jgi:hypothetical protein
MLIPWVQLLSSHGPNYSLKSMRHAIVKQFYFSVENRNDTFNDECHSLLDML